MSKPDALISPLAIAPMIDWTYSHFRVFMRMLTPHGLLYTDMQTAGAIFNNPLRALGFHSMENPLALQLGGSNPRELAECAKRAEDAGFVEVNLNLGCPSDRVQSGRFGACMMKEPDLAAACISAMKEAVTIPVTAKTRIGVDKQESYDFFEQFATCLVEAGADKLIVHARKAWLKGLSPKQNRTIPPINYDFVYQIKTALPSIPIIINGNINQFSEIKWHLNIVDGVMLGRLACNNPYAIAQIEHQLFDQHELPTRMQLMGQYLPYIEEQKELGVSMSLLIKPILNLAHGLPKSKAWKELVLTAQRKSNLSYLRQALELLASMENRCRESVA